MFVCSWQKITRRLNIPTAEKFYFYMGQFCAALLMLHHHHLPLTTTILISFSPLLYYKTEPALYGKTYREALADKSQTL